MSLKMATSCYLGSMYKEQIMEEKNQMNIDPNEIHVNIKKRDTDANLFDSDCCSVMALVLTADGRLATSYFGLHTPEVIKAMKKITNEYYAKLVKEFKRQYKEEKARIKGIKVFKDKNPEIDDETLIKLAEEFREIKRKEEESAAIELEKNKPVENRQACIPAEDVEKTQKSCGKKIETKTDAKKTSKISSKISTNKTTKK